MEKRNMVMKKVVQKGFNIYKITSNKKTKGEIKPDKEEMVLK
jgi:hypothetical protein